MGVPQPSSSHGPCSTRVFSLRQCNHLQMHLYPNLHLILYTHLTYLQTHTSNCIYTWTYSHTCIYTPTFTCIYRYTYDCIYTPPAISSTPEATAASTLACTCTYTYTYTYTRSTPVPVSHLTAIATLQLSPSLAPLSPPECCPALTDSSALLPSSPGQCRSRH